MSIQGDVCQTYGSGHYAAPIRRRDSRTAEPGDEADSRVVSTKIVKPEDVGVLAQGVGEVLTLVTCYPFYFVGPAPSRFIVRAERVI
jgi:hypothetical protein